MAAVLEPASIVKLMIFDIDGVFTDGSLFFTAEGDAMKSFTTKTCRANARPVAPCEHGSASSSVPSSRSVIAMTISSLVLNWR